VLKIQIFDDELATMSVMQRRAFTVANWQRSPISSTQLMAAENFSINVNMAENFTIRRTFERPDQGLNLSLATQSSSPSFGLGFHEL
jgi:hypothetical protein